MKKYIHYGHTYFDPQLFTSVRNSFMAKPEGGFWASDINAKRGWAEWCADEGFRECNINNSFTFSLAVNAKILTINSVDDLEKLPKIKSDSWFAHSMCGGCYWIMNYWQKNMTLSKLTLAKMEGYILLYMDGTATVL